MENETNVTKKPNIIVGWLLTILLFVLLIVGLAIFLPVYLIWWLIKSIFGLGKKESDIRAKSGVLQSPVVTFEKDETSPKIIFVGAVHVGEEQYYQQVQNILDRSFELGDSILVEGVGKNDIPEQEMTSQQKDKLTQMDKLFKFQSKIPPMLGLIHQRDGINYNPQWKNSDTSLKEIVNLMVEQDAEALSPEDMKRLEELFTDPKVQKLLPISLDIAFSRILPYLSDKLSMTAKQKKFQRIITENREGQLFASVCSELNKKENVVLFWGSAHLKGMTKRLHDLGYYETDRKWLDVFHSRFSNMTDLNQALKQATESIEKEE